MRFEKKWFTTIVKQNWEFGVGSGEQPICSNSIQERICYTHMQKKKLPSVAGVSEPLCLFFLCFRLRFVWTCIEYLYCSGKGPGCKRNPASWRGVKECNSLPPTAKKNQ